MSPKELAVQTTDREREALREILESHTLFISCRRFVWPDLTKVHTSLSSPVEMPITRLLELLSFSDYEAQTFTLVNQKYTGAFTANGQQVLADLLGKPIAFPYQETSEPLIDTKNSPKYYPKKNLNGFG